MTNDTSFWCSMLEKQKLLYIFDLKVMNLFRKKNEHNFPNIFRIIKEVSYPLLAYRTSTGSSCLAAVA